MILLDIDGVIRTRRSIAGSYDMYGNPKFDSLYVPIDSYATSSIFETVDPISVGLVNRLVSNFDQRCYLTSRVGCLFKDDLAGLRSFMFRCGLNGDKFDGVLTKRDIPAFVLQQKSQCIVFDDEDIGVESLIKVDPTIGISFSNYEEAFRKLSNAVWKL